jgi:hypothetical protein
MGSSWIIAKLLGGASDWLPYSIALRKVVSRMGISAYGNEGEYHGAQRQNRLDKSKGIRGASGPFHPAREIRQEPGSFQRVSKREGSEHS